MSAFDKFGYDYTKVAYSISIPDVSVGRDIRFDEALDMLYRAFGKKDGDRVACAVAAQVLGAAGGYPNFADPVRAELDLLRTQAALTQNQKDQLETKLKEYVAAFELLKKQAHPYASVLSVRGDKVVLLSNGKSVEVEKPKQKDGQKPLGPGATVSIVADTMQIFEVIEDGNVATGEVCQVSRVVPAANGMAPTCEIERAGTSRAVTFDGVVEEGDRVVLDQAGMVVVANLGKAESDCVVSEATGVTWDDIGGLTDAKRQLREAIEAPTKHSDMMRRYRKKPIKGVLLHGSPGCGKTMLGKAAATALAELHGNAAAGAFFYVKGPELLNMYVGNSEASVRKLFDTARRHKKKYGHAAIIFIDEADAILGKRDTRFSSALSSTLVPAFLAEMDGLEDSGALVLLATNRPNTLDSAIVRDGRVDRRIRVTRPDKEDARAILLTHLRERPLVMPEPEAADIISEALYDTKLGLYTVQKIGDKGSARLCLGHIVSGAMLAGIVDRATSVAMQRELGGGDAGVQPGDLRAAVHETYEQARDVNHDEEIAEFCEGWEHQVEKVNRISRKTGPASKTAN